MSENYQSDVKLDENANGTVSFATEVVATIAGLAVTEVDGVASMSSQSTGFADMFSRKNARSLSKGVRIDLDGNKVTVDVTIVVEYGSPVPEVAKNIQENVKKAIETMTGLDVHAIDVHIAGISFARENRTAAELNEQQMKILKGSEEKAAEEAAPEAAEEAAPTEEKAEEAAPEAAEEAAETEAAEESEEAEEEDDIEEEDPEDEETEDEVAEEEPDVPAEAE